MSDVIFLEGPQSEGPKSDKTTATPSSKRLGCLIEGAILLMALALGLLIRFGWLETAIVTSDSMQPTLMRGDRLLVDHRASLHGTWQRGDVVIFDAPAAWGEEGETLVKRIIGLPGEKIWFVDGHLWINNAEVPENYLNGVMPPETSAPFSIEAGQYFVMGDNRGNSEDSRVNGTLPEAQIRGRVLRILGPWGRTGTLPAVAY